jgi:hypothetical protein
MGTEREIELEARVRELNRRLDSEQDALRACERELAEADAGVSEESARLLFELQRFTEQLWDLLPLSGTPDRERALAFLRRESRSRGWLLRRAS